MATAKRLKQLEKIVDSLSTEVNELYVGDALNERVARALQEVLETNQAITIKNYVNGIEVTSKLLRDRNRELKRKQEELEIALDRIKELQEEISTVLEEK